MISIRSLSNGCARIGESVRHGGMHIERRPIRNISPGTSYKNIRLWEKRIDLWGGGRRPDLRPGPPPRGKVVQQGRAGRPGRPFLNYLFPTGPEARAQVHLQQVRTWLRTSMPRAFRSPGPGPGHRARRGRGAGRGPGIDGPGWSGEGGREPSAVTPMTFRLLA